MRNLIQKYRQYMVPAILLAIMVLAIGYHRFPISYWNHYFIPEAPAQVTVVSLGSTNKPIRLLRTGSTAKSSNIPVNTEYSGSLSEIYVTEGQAVKAGQPLFKLEASAGEGPSVNTPASGVSAQMQNQYENALKDFNRYQALYEQGAVSRRQLENANARLKEAEASLDNGSRKMSATLQGTATIVAPIDGIVTGLAVGSGKTVQAGQQLLALGGGQDIEVVVQLSQADLYLAHLGSAVVIDLPGQTMMGQIASIDLVVEADQISSFLAHIKLMDKPAAVLTPGMSIGVHIDTGQMAPVFVLPTASIFHDEQGRSFIYAAVHDKAVRQEIAVGEALGEFTEITSPMAQDIMVITSNIDELKNGSAIVIR